jgi:hypothetical protein
VRKLISILVALGLLISFSAMATPVAAVEEGTVSVTLFNPVAKEVSDYCIKFHNIGTLETDDYIDIMFPLGTDVTGAYVNWVQTRNTPIPNPPIGCPPPIVPVAACNWTDPSYPDVVTLPAVTVTPIGTKTLRLTLTGGNITKCQNVLISISNVTNPTSCEHHLEVGTTTHTPVDSDPYTIYCAKLTLAGGKYPFTGLDMMNLISLPCYPSDTSIETVLAALFCQVTITANMPNPFSFSVWYWDNAAKKWLKYVSDSSFTDLKTIEAGKAYWIKPSESIDFYVHGDPYPAGQGPPVKWCYPRCWNMVGFASLSSMNITEYLKYTLLPPTYHDAVMAVWGWNSTIQSYIDLGWPGVTFNLTPGEGYWMAFLDEACIIPPAQADC